MFEPVDFSIPLIFFFAFIGLAAFSLVIYVMAKRGSFDRLKHLDFVKNIMVEFNEESVGNHLVLDIVDYKKNKRESQSQELARRQAVANETTANESLNESTLES